MNSPSLSPSQALNDVQREKLLKILAAGTFLIFFQAYMIAPLIPRLAEIFSVTNEKAGILVPAYMIPYGISTLFFGILSDRLGRKKIMIVSMAAFVGLTFLTMAAQSMNQFLVLRFLTGLGASGVIPLSLSLIGQLYPYESRGRPLGWLFGAMAGGMAFGSTFGAVSEPYTGWQALFGMTAVFTFIILLLLMPYRKFLGGATQGQKITVFGFFNSYKSLVTDPRGMRTYTYVFLNAIFHSGVFTWLGLYFKERYNLTEPQIGIALLGYGFPGLIFGPVLGRMADKYGRRWLLPIGFAVAAVSALFLGLDINLVFAAVAVTILSLGYDMTQPLLAGIVTTIDKKKPGQAMGLNVFLLFIGFGIGSALFGSSLRLGLTNTLIIFAVFQALNFLVSIMVFKNEKRIQ